ncbi:MAG: hypothetical protein AAF734_03785 [Bacteroidota bacterium]
MFKKLFSLLPPFLRDGLRQIQWKKDLKKWESLGKPLPPPHIVKQLTIESYAKEHHIDIFVETGTHRGTTLERQRRNFKKLYSIELDKKLYESASKRFKRYSHVQVLQGDSNVKLKEIVESLSEKALFWLDAHYSGIGTARGVLDCPIYRELKAIFESRQKHVILIDDARLFIGKDDYPTVQELRAFVDQYDESTQMIVEHDIIRLF